MKYNLFMTSIVAIMLSMVVSKIVYFGFTSSNDKDFSNRKAFITKYNHDGYQYRVLSKSLLFGVEDLLRKDVKDNGGEAQVFFNALYYINTLFLMLTSLLVAQLLNLDKRLRFSDNEKMLVLFLVPILIGLTQSVLNYYDLSSYFLQLLVLYLFLRNTDAHYGQTMGAIMGLVVVSTLNRESAEVSVGMIAVLLVSRYGVTSRVVWSIGGMLACYVGTYFVLRLVIPTPPPPPHLLFPGAASHGLLVGDNMTGLIFWFLFLYLAFAIAESDENRWLIGGFLLFCLPYIISCFAGGDLWSVRLYVPLFLGTLFLSKVDVAGAALRISERKWVGRRPLSPAADRR